MSGHGELKHQVARTLKWNAIDKVLSQALYALTGIVLANLLPLEDFGLVGAVLVFQSFATLFCDSGFSYALIQRDHPTQQDYSTVLWFNLGMALLIYAILFVGAPLIALCYHGDQRLIPLSRVMFLTFILNSASVVQANRLIKQLDVRMVTISNNAGLFVGSVVGIALALLDFGPWALVAQNIALSGVKTLILWTCVRWKPSFTFSWAILRSYLKVGMGVLGSSFLNVLFQNIYSLVIGNRNSFTSLAYYTQGDKWSRMGIASLSAIITQTFLPVLSRFQHDPDQYAAATKRINAISAYLVFPFCGLLIVVATPVFHALFDTKWDPAIPLFQLLMLRGIFTILSSMYNNYLLALGLARLMFNCELLRDIVALVALVATLPSITLTTPDDPVLGIRIMIYGQLFASVITWIVTLWLAARHSHRTPGAFIFDLLPYAAGALLITIPLTLLPPIIHTPWLLAATQSISGAALYLALNALFHSRVQREALSHLR